jgi:hypothetical protein
MIRHYTVFGAFLTATALSSGMVHAAAGGGGGGGGASLTPVTTTTYTDQSFSTIFERVTLSFGGLPGLISMFAYLTGIIFAFSGILKIKEHVESPDKHDLKSGAIRLVAGGALFALPLITATMTSTVGDQSTAVAAPKLNKAAFGVN